jgi:deoxycytidine triphosphate deaminase
MGLLTDTDLTNLIEDGKNWSDKDKLHIFPYDPECLTPIGYDLRIGPQYASSIDAELYSINTDDKVIIKPGDTVLITTLEDIGMPQDRTISAFITSKVSKVSKGLSHISTNIDPDWKGPLLIALHNPSRNTVSLSYGEAFCTINFIENKSPATMDCGKEPGRSDILLKQFLKDVKEARKKAEATFNKKHKRSLIYKATVIVLFSFVGYLLLGLTPGFPAMVALGVALSNFISLPQKD